MLKYLVKVISPKGIMMCSKFEVDDPSAITIILFSNVKE